jgi:hypothetical protein
MTEFFGDLWPTVLTIGSALGTYALFSVKSYIKNKFSSSVTTNLKTTLVKEIGEEETDALLKFVKAYGVRKLVDTLDILLSKNDKVDQMLKVIMLNQLALGAYDDNLELKKVVESLVK